MSIYQTKRSDAQQGGTSRSRPCTRNKLLRIKESIIQLCSLCREHVDGHPGLCTITEFCMKTCAEDFPKKPKIS